MSGFVLGIGAVFLARKVGWAPDDDIWRILLIASIPYAGIVIVTLVVNAIRAPVKLDNHRATRVSVIRKSAHERLETLKVQAATLTQKPKRTPAEEHLFQVASAALDRHGEVAVNTLRYFKQAGRIYQNPQGQLLARPPGLNQNDAIAIYTRLLQENLLRRTPNVLPGETGTEYIWEIAPAMIAALDELLFP